METTPLRAQILDTIIRKSTLKQRVFDNTFGAFNSLKAVSYTHLTLPTTPYV